MPDYLRNRSAAFSQQPPANTLARRGGLGQGLVLSAADPRFLIQDHKRGWLKTENAVNQRAFGNMPYGGRGALVTTAANNPVYIPDVIGANMPMGATSIMCVFRKNAPQGIEGVLVGWGGFSHGGFALQVDSAFMINGDGMTGIYPGVPQVIVDDTDYVVITTFSGNATGADVDIWFRKLGTFQHFAQQAPSTTMTGAWSTPNRGFNLGGVFNSNQGTPGYVGQFNGVIGSFGWWGRQLSDSEIMRLLENPFQLWQPSNAYDYVLTNSPVNTTFTNPSAAVATVGTTTQVGRATTPVSGVSATGAVGTVTMPNANVILTGVQGSIALGTTTQKGNAGHTLTGLQRTASIGVVSVGGGMNVVVTGMQATTSLGTGAAVKANAGVTPSGLVGTASIGSTASAAGHQPVTMPQMKGSIGGVNIAGWNAIATAPGGDWATIQAGG